MNFAVFVNTTDNFEDCWLPFFTLFKKYWPNYSGKIYLNTETKSYTFDGLNIVSIKNAQHIAGKPNWPKSFLAALDYMEEDIILYLQEDYFFKNFVDNDFVKNTVDVMLADNTISCIHLTDQATTGPFIEYAPNNHYKLIAKNAAYRISCQAALWRKKELKKYIRTYETPWQFELIGTQRAKHLYNDTFLIINTQVYGIGKKEIVPYVFTGIVKGKWKQEVVSLFDTHNINVNFSKRGFIEDAPHATKKFTKRTKDYFFKIASLSEIVLKKITKINYNDYLV